MLCYPLNNNAVKHFNNIFTNLFVPGKHPITVRKAIRDVHSTLPKNTFCFVANDNGMRNLFVDNIIGLQDNTHIIWCLPSATSLDKVQSKLNIYGKWDTIGKTTTTQLLPNVRFMFTSALHEVIEAHSVVYDLVHHCVVDWSGTQVSKWLSSV